MSEQATYTEHVYQEYSCGSFVDPLHQREEIVRCRDCRYYSEYQDLCERLQPGMLVMEADGFCAWGELRCDAE